jgi:1-aminocyclopropane-1-carboxylate deaminase/D-cysteine desulfhydrase-like pyridoxal-dependent ACC family enzyme
VKVADLPTPLHDCPRFSAALGGKVRVMVKRDDMTGLAFGGNKTRKFDFSFADARAEGATAVITGAASQSNHARQAAAAAARLGMKCVLVNRHDHRSQMGIQGNQLLDHILGAEVHLVAGGDAGAVKEKVAQDLRRRGEVPYLIGSRAAALGAAAYTGCVLEILDQLEAVDARADFLCVASGHGTHAGIALGAKSLGLDLKVQGYSPGRGPEGPRREGIAQVGNEAAALMGVETRLTPEEIDNTDAWTGENYGIVTEAGLEAIHLLARTEGILLDPVYTGKAVSGVIDRIRGGAIPAGATVVYIHTGGTPALFAYAPELIGHGDYRPTIVRG